MRENLLDRACSAPLLVTAMFAALLHCGGPQEGAASPSGPGAAAADAGVQATEDSPFVPRSNDPICGGGYRWAASRCIADDDQKTSATERRAAALSRETRKGDGGLVIEDIAVGQGREVRIGDIVRLHYTGTLTDGSTFDSSRSGGKPFEFRVGQGQVIKGFDRGVLGMKVGGRRKITIPYQLGYGADGSPPRIPPRATLIFDLELLDVM